MKKDFNTFEAFELFITFIERFLLDVYSKDQIVIPGLGLQIPLAEFRTQYVGLWNAYYENGYWGIAAFLNEYYAKTKTPVLTKIYNFEKSEDLVYFLATFLFAQKAEDIKIGVAGKAKEDLYTIPGLGFSFYAHSLVKFLTTMHNFYVIKGFIGLLDFFDDHLKSATTKAIQKNGRAAYEKALEKRQDGVHFNHLELVGRVGDTGYLSKLRKEIEAKIIEVERGEKK